MSVNSYADSSAVKLSVAVANYASRKEWEAGGSVKRNFSVLPFTTESFKASKETKMSTAINGSRRQSGSKNMKGSASGGFTVEASINNLLTDVILPSAMMSSWTGAEVVTAFLTNPYHQVKVATVGNQTVVSGLETSGTSLYVYVGLDSNGAPKQAKYGSYNPTAADPYTYTVAVSGNKVTPGTGSATNDVYTLNSATHYDHTATSARIKFVVTVKKFVSTGVYETYTTSVIQTIYKKDYDTYAFKRDDDTNGLPVAGSRVRGTDVTVEGKVVTGSDGTLAANNTSVSAIVTYKVLGVIVDNNESYPLTGGVFSQTLVAPKGCSEVIVRFKYGSKTVDYYRVPLIYSDVKDITDGTTLTPLLFEKYEKNTVNGVTYHEFNQFFGTCINEFNLEFADGDFVKASVTTMSTDYNLSRDSSTTTSDDLTGSLASAYVTEPVADLLDTTNSIRQIVLKDEDGDVIPAVFSSASLKITNNLREQAALGYEYMAGLGVGKVNATLSGDIYFYNNDIFDKHLNNGRVSAVITLTGESESISITLPKLTIAAPSNNAQGENQDYKTNVTFNAEAGVAELNNGVQKECVIAFSLNPL